MLRRIITTIFLVILMLLAYFSSVFSKKNEYVAIQSEVSDIKTVIIDAGHGGFDGGAVASDGTIEKELNLEIALKLDNILRSMGFNTVLIRNQDVSVEDSGDTIHSKKVSDIKHRLKIMGQHKNAIYVSVHMNKYSSSQPHGAQVFYSSFGNSKKLAENIQFSISENIQQDNKRVIKPATKDIYLLYNAVAPAVIVECGFLSNKNDLDNLKNEDYQLKMALCLTFGILDYYSFEDV